MDIFRCHLEEQNGSLKLGLASGPAICTVSCVPKPTTATVTPLQNIAAAFGSVLLKGLAWTLRFELKDEAGCYDSNRQRPVIVCIWHNRILGAVLSDYHANLRKRIPLSVLTSASKDGGWLAAVARRFRMGAVRGSSSRRGAATSCSMLVCPCGSIHIVLDALMSTSAESFSTRVVCASAAGP